MVIRWTFALVVALFVWIAQEAVGADQQAPPELGLAVTVDGRTLEIHRFVERLVTRTTTEPTLTPSGAVNATRTETAAVVETQITRMDLTRIVARRMDGRAITSAALLQELTRPTPVALIKQGQQVDQRLLGMFRPESVVLQLR